VKKLFSILIFVVFSSVSFAEEIPSKWKWEKVYNSIVLVSGENIVEKIEPLPFPELDNGPDKRPHPDKVVPSPNTLIPRLIPYGMGTGFFINKIHIVTNYHVIKEFNKLTVFTFNHPYPITDVTVIGFDEEIDIAVLQINEKGLLNEFLEFADKTPMIGDDVYAIGHGMSQIWSLTKGILSYDYRTNPISSFVHYLQTDAVINSGNSGGPLLNNNKKIIGVNTLIMSPDKYYVGYGYVIPTPLVKRVVEQILATGKHVKPSIGIIMGITEDRELYDKLRADGVDHFLEIREVVEGSPAERFGLLADDIIVSIDDSDIQVMPQVIEFLWTRNPGDQVTFKVYRNGEYKLINVVLTTAETPDIVTSYGKK
jgi:serine protease Do